MILRDIQDEIEGLGVWLWIEQIGCFFEDDLLMLILNIMLVLEDLPESAYSMGKAIVSEYLEA